MCILSRRLLSMSLPVSLTTDCGGLLNRRGPGRKRCCHTEALHAGYHVILFTRMVLVPNYRIGLFSHGASRRVTVFSHEFSFCPELSNLRIVEFFFTRRIAESHGVLSRDLSFGPTDQREVIIVFLSSHGESRRVSGFMSRIIEFLFTRRITEFFFVTRHVLGPEFANCRISFFTRMVAEVMRVEL